MHELPATEGVLATAVEAAGAAGARRVLVIDLVVGGLSSMVDDAVQFYFDVLSRGTPAEGAALRFRRVPGAGLCLDCGHRYPAVPPLPPACPACAGAAVRVSGGQEFYVESIEVEDADDRSGGEQGAEGE